MNRYEEFKKQCRIHIQNDCTVTEILKMLDEAYKLGQQKGDRK